MHSKNVIYCQLKEACQVWLEIDVEDFIAIGCKWAEVNDLCL